MQYSTCRHLKEDGTYCGSPALTGRAYCYFHLNLRGRRLRRAQAHRGGLPCRLHLPALDNLRALQVAISEVLDAMAEGQIDTNAAGTMLYGIQQATSILKAVQDLEQWTDADDVDETDRVLEFPQFEQKFGVPPGIDLESDPDLALQQAEAHPAAAPAEQPAQPVQSASAPQSARASSRQAKDDNQREPSFKELKQQLRILQDTVHRDATSKKPPAPAPPTVKEATDTA